MLRELSTGRFKVFIAEDSVLMTERLTELLQTLPQVEVCGVADNVAQTIHSVLNHPIDVIILDLDLVGGSGLEVLKAIKQRPQSPIAIVLTIHSFHDLGQHCLDAGADYYFEKGNDFDVVLNLLEKLSADRTSRSA